MLILTLRQAAVLVLTLRQAAVLVLTPRQAAALVLTLRQAAVLVLTNEIGSSALERPSCEGPYVYLNTTHTQTHRHTHGPALVNHLQTIENTEIVWRRGRKVWLLTYGPLAHNCALHAFPLTSQSLNTLTSDHQAEKKLRYFMSKLCT